MTLRSGYLKILSLEVASSYISIYSQSYKMFSVLLNCCSSYPRKSTFLHCQPSVPSSGSSRPSPYPGCLVPVHPVLSLLTLLFLIVV